VIYLLDTNACVRILNHSSPRLIDQLQEQDPVDIGLCSITKAELLYGARHSIRAEENLKLLQKFFDPFVSLPFDDRSADHYAIIRSDLARRGQLIGPNDMLIAAIAMAHDLILVTHNTEEFSRIIGLRLEDWEE